MIHDPMVTPKEVRALRSYLLPPLSLAAHALAMLVAGCGTAPGDANSDEANGSGVVVSATTAAPPRFMVCGVDRSGSYNFVALGLDLCARLIVEARGGDAVVIRWVSDASLRNEEFVARIEIPTVALPDCGDNPFNPRCKRERAAAEGRVNAFKRAAIQRILSLRPKSAPRTDILGFIQASSDAYEQAPNDASRELYIATDLVDNVRHNVAPDLEGVTVTVLAFQTDSNPARTLALRKEWERILRKYGAEKVTFRAAEVVR